MSSEPTTMFKLVRDGMRPYPGTEVQYCATLHNLDMFLRAKLMEESREAAGAKNKEEFLEEIADVAEVIEHLMSIYHISQADLRKVKDKKRAVRGGFGAGKLFKITGKES